MATEKDVQRSAHTDHRGADTEGGVDKSAAEAATRERNTETTGVNAERGTRSNQGATSEASTRPISEQNKSTTSV